ncbi:recombinase family protein [Plantibacter flavus]|uniref:recombinase family protein n=1 Tax=Plantibacter flavus TaxID=150123 RepID=UPI001F36FAEC|nr:recombinase family protein [Plantibacter flavus]
MLESDERHVRSLSDGIDPATSTGRLMLHLIAALAEYERELIVKRVNTVIAAAHQSASRFRGLRADQRHGEVKS